MFNDPLFVRSARGITPTARATELAAPVRAALSAIRVALGAAAAFDPSTSTRRFTIATTDYGEVATVGPLLELLRREAPGIELRVRRLSHIFEPPAEELATGVYDAAFSFFPDASALPSGIHMLDLWSEANVILSGTRRAPLSAAAFAAAPNVGIFYRTAAAGLIDKVLAARGLERTLSVTVPHFLTVPFLLAGSKYLACVPEGVAAVFRRALRLHVVRVDFPLPQFEMRLLWHERTHTDPAHRWLRDRIAQLPTYHGNL